MIALGLLLALEGFPDADLPRFYPAIPGMVAVYRYTDRQGQAFRTSTLVTQRVDRPDGTFARLLARQRDVMTNGAVRSNLAQGTIFPDRLEVEDLESEREPTVELRTPLRPGASWTYKLTGGEGRRTILGIEPVTVAAGTFPKALHVRVRSRFAGGELDSDLWYVPDVGLVKVQGEQGSAELVAIKRDPVPTRRP